MSLVKNSILYLVSTILIKATTFFLLPFYSYLVTPEEYGYVYVVSAASMFIMFVMLLSIHACISRFLFDCDNNEDVKRLYSTIVYLLGINSTIIALILILFEDILSDFVKLPLLYYRLTIIISYLGAFYNIILALLYAKQEAKLVSITLSVVGVLNIIVQLIFVFTMSNKALALILAMLVNSILTFVIFIIFSKPYMMLSLDILNIKKYLYYALSQFPSDISSWIAKFTDRVIINKFIGPADTGIYGTGTTVGMIPQVIFQSMNQAYTPYVYTNYKKIEKGDQTGMKEVIRVTTIVCTLITMLITLLIIFSNNVIKLFAESYSSAFWIIVVMLIASLFENFRCIFMLPMCYNIKYTKIKSLIWVVASIFNLGVNIVVIPRCGIMGACFTALFTYMITFITLLFFSNKAIPIQYEWKKIWNVVFISIIASLSLILGDGLFVMILKFVLVVIYLYVCFKIVDAHLILNLLDYVKIHINKR